VKPEKPTARSWPLPGCYPAFFRRDQAAAYLGMSAAMLDNEVRNGRLPPPVNTAGTIKAWHRADLDSWAEDRRLAASASSKPNEWDSV
jgi:predicted DNA-binding transcriptional regulator AlpA